MIKRVLIAVLSVAVLLALVISCAPPQTTAPVLSTENEVIIPIESVEPDSNASDDSSDDVDELLPESIEDEQAVPSTSYTSYADPFDPYDWTLRGLDEHSSPEDAVDVFGEPESQSDENGVLTYEYPWGGLVFNTIEGTKNMLLRGGYYIDATYSGPRDLHVGESIDKLTASFPADFMRDQNGSTVLYCANSSDYDGLPEPPCGIMQYEDGKPVSLTVSAPVSPINGVADGSAQLYMCSFTIKDNIITRIEYSFSDVESLNKLVI